MENGKGQLEFRKFPFSDLISSEYLYNTHSYLLEYDTKDLVRLQWKSQKGNTCSLTGVIRDSQFSSVPWGTFGGFEVEHGAGEDEIREFIALVVSSAQQMELKELRIKLPPDFYLQKVPALKQSLHCHQFVAVRSDINQHIEINSKQYRQRITYNELKKLKKSENEGFTFAKLNRQHLPEAYRLIRDNRIRKGFPVSMTLQTLDNMFEKLPQHYHLFGIYDNKKLIATGVSIRVNQASLYNFYHGDDQEYRVYSPVVMLLDGIYSYCQQSQIETLDLGISSDQGELNKGLFVFKKNCGAIESAKDILVRTFN
ncbi:MAG: GNAT family N-acetyltransferase [Bacteroidota bacterium]